MNLAAVAEHAHEQAVAWPYSLADAREWLLEASAILREAGDLRGVAQTVENLGVVSAMEGHQDRARSYFRQCLDHYRQLGDKKGVGGRQRGREPPSSNRHCNRHGNRPAAPGLRLRFHLRWVDV